jgi:hypothetical protein
MERRLSAGRLRPHSAAVVAADRRLEAALTGRQDAGAPRRIFLVASTFTRTNEG